MKECNICVTSKAVRYKLYGDLQLLPVLTHCWKDLSMDFVTGLPVSANWKGETYDSILVIVDRITKKVYYELVKVIIDVLGLTKVIIDVVVRHYSLPNLIISN